MAPVDGPAVGYALRKWLFSYCRRVQVEHSSVPIRTWACINVSEHVIASIIYDGRSEMSLVAFRTAPPIGGISCCNFVVVLGALLALSVKRRKLSLFGHVCRHDALPKTYYREQ